MNALDRMKSTMPISISFLSDNRLLFTDETDRSIRILEHEISQDIYLI